MAMFILFLFVFFLFLFTLRAVDKPQIKVSSARLSGNQVLWLRSQEAADLGRGVCAHKVQNLLKELRMVETRSRWWVTAAMALVGTWLTLDVASGDVQVASSPLHVAIAQQLLSRASGTVKGQLRKVLVDRKVKPVPSELGNLIGLIKSGEKVKGIGPKIEAHIADAEALTHMDRTWSAGLPRRKRKDRGSDPTTIWLKDQMKKRRARAQTEEFDLIERLNKDLDWAIKAHHAEPTEATLKKQIALEAILWGFLIETFGVDGEWVYQALKEEKHEWLLWKNERLKNALTHLAREHGHWLPLVEELQGAHAKAPVQYILSSENLRGFATAKTWIGLEICTQMGLVSTFRASSSRIICGPKGFDLNMIASFLEGMDLTPDRVLKGHKYVKSLWNPMSMVGKSTITEDDVIIVPQHGVEECAIDGAVLITEDTVKETLGHPATHARKAWKKGDLVDSTFIGRLFIPERPLIKGGFTVVLTHWLKFGGQQYHVAASEQKGEVKVKGPRAILASTSKPKRPKKAASDLQNFLMSLSIRAKEGAEVIRLILRGMVRRRRKLIEYLLNEIDTDGSSLNHADEHELNVVVNEDLKEVAVSKALMAKGMSPASIPALFASLLSRAGDGQFDPSRFRVDGEIELENKKSVVWRESHYTQPHPGRTLLALEASLGKAEWTLEEREFFESWKAMKVNQIMCSPELYQRVMEEHGTNKVYVTRRPMTATGGCVMELVPHEFLRGSTATYVAPVADIKEYFLEPLDGADFDDSFEFNYGKVGELMIKWDAEKRTILKEGQSGLEVTKNLQKLMGGRRVWGLTFREHVKTWKYLPKKEKARRKEVIAAAHGKHASKAYKRFSMESLFDLSTKLKQMEVGNPTETWANPTILEDISAWTGSAANAQMFATFVLQGFVFGEDHPHRELAHAIAKELTSIMLSDIIDATQQGAKVKEAIDNMAALQLGMLCLAELALTGNKVLDMPKPCQQRAMWTFKNLIKPVTFRVKNEAGNHATVVVAGRRSYVEKTFTPDHLKYEGGNWEMFNLLDKYTEWYLNKVTHMIREENGGMERLARLADETLDSQRGARKEVASWHNLLKEGRKETGARWRALAQIRPEPGDKMIASWVAAPLNEVMSECIGQGYKTRNFMLTLVSAWQNIDAAETKVEIDPSTQKLSVKGGGDRSAIYGDVNEVAGPWRYFVKWIMEQDMDEGPDQLTFYYKDAEGRKVKEEVMKAASKAKKVGKLMEAGFGLVNGSDPNATSLNRALHRTRRFDKTDNRKFYNARIDTLVGRRIESVEIVRNERMESWGVRVTLG